jgi:hypothetical protein
MVAQADLAYKDMLRKYNIAKYGRGGVGFYDHGAITFN